MIMDEKLQDVVTEFPELADFMSLKKKKKNKFPKDENDSLESNTMAKDSSLEKVDVSALSIQAPEFDTELDFDLMKKKKKKKSKSDAFSLSTDDGVEIQVDKVDSLSVQFNMSDADYTYEDLLTRAFNIMREKDPNRDMEGKKKVIMKPPQIIRIGTKKSSFVNFLEICKLLHRTPQHLQSFLLVELGTSGSVDGNNQLIIKGRFEQKQMENVLRRYIKEYVSCHTCRSPETVLQKDTRLFFLQCESCGARCSVASIKAGFQAVTGKRAALRAKTN